MPRSRPQLHLKSIATCSAGSNGANEASSGLPTGYVKAKANSFTSTAVAAVLHWQMDVSMS